MSKAARLNVPPRSTWALIFLYRITTLVLFVSIAFAIYICILYALRKAEIRMNGLSGWLILLGAYAAYFSVTYSFWSVLRVVLKGKVFDLVNVISFRRIATTLIFVGVWNHLLSQMLDISPDGRIMSLGGPVKITAKFPDVILNEFTAALVAFALAEIFRQGYLIRQEELRLRAEQDLTV
jgi:Protein of unknown function (DUF2975)